VKVANRGGIVSADKAHGCRPVWYRHHYHGEIWSSGIIEDLCSLRPRHNLGERDAVFASGVCRGGRGRRSRRGSDSRRLGTRDWRRGGGGQEKTNKAGEQASPGDVNTGRGTVRGLIHKGNTGTSETLLT
jgi:hypothetical protein